MSRRIVLPQSFWISSPESGRRSRRPEIWDYLFGATHTPVDDKPALLRRLIDFANGDTDLAVCRMPVERQAELLGRVSDAKPDRDLEAQRTRVQSILVGALSGVDGPDFWRLMDDSGEKSTDPETGRTVISHGLGGVVLRPAIDGIGGGLSWNFRLDEFAPGTDLDKAIHFFANLLLWNDDKCRTDLARCQWEPCGRFFRVVREGRGQPRKKYCCDEHMFLAHQKDSPRRRREAKEKKAAEAKKPRRRRSS